MQPIGLEATATEPEIVEEGDIDVTPHCLPHPKFPLSPRPVPGNPVLPPFPSRNVIIAPDDEHER